MKRFPVPASLGLLLFLLILAGRPLEAQAFSFFGLGATENERRQTQTYTPEDWPAPLSGDLFLPRLKTGQTSPVVLLLHGGAWRRGDRSKMERIGRLLAEKGFAAFAIDYRLAPQFRHPAQLEDMQQALRWLQQHADEYRLDMHRVGAWGYSAGGHLAALLAVQPPSRELPALRVVIAGGAPADLRVYPDASSVRGFLGGRLADMPDTYAAASPMAQVRAGLPAFFLYHGTADDLVVSSQSENFAKALAAAGVPVELRLIDGANHRGAATEARKLIPEALGFLARHISVPDDRSSEVKKNVAN
ncbi:MAG: lipase [Moraxellaceae bacterium]|jgi:acetyl esterase/lipase|nr:lipase [Moraxellaceae bacterium]